MVKVILTKDTYSQSIKARYGNFYYIRIPIIESDTIECVEEIVHHEPTEEDFENLKDNWIRFRVKERLSEIDKYDQSELINSFLVNNNHYWLDKATRVGLVNSTLLEKESGYELTTLWLGDQEFQVQCDKVLDVLRQIEVYAKACYNKTAEHKYNIKYMTDISELENYDITVGYPEKLNFEL